MNFDVGQAALIDDVLRDGGLVIRRRVVVLAVYHWGWVASVLCRLLLDSCVELILCLFQLWNVLLLMWCLAICNRHAVKVVVWAPSLNIDGDTPLFGVRIGLWMWRWDYALYVHKQVFIGLLRASVCVRLMIKLLGFCCVSGCKLLFL